MTEQERTELLRKAALENAIASGEMEGLEFTPAMRALLEQASNNALTDAEFDRAVLALAHG